MNAFDKLRDFWHRRVRDTESPDDSDQPDDDEPAGDCVGGADHEPVEVRAATSRAPLYTFCKVCRKVL